MQLRNGIRYHLVGRKSRVLQKNTGIRTRRNVFKNMKETESIVGKVTEPKSGMSSTTDIIIPPDLQKANKHIARPSALIKQNSVASKVSKVVDSIKGKLIKL